MTSLASMIARGRRLPFGVLVQKLGQRGRGLTDRLVTRPEAGWSRRRVPSHQLGAVAAGLGRRFLVGPDDRPGLVTVLQARDPAASAAIVRQADLVCAHRFDLLGSGPTDLGPRIDWHRDFRSGRRWELRHHTAIDYLDLGHASDVKVVWELSRCHHWVTLGQAYWLTGDDRYVDEFLSQLDGWMKDNPPRFGVNWTCAMEVAVRAVNWLWAFALFAAVPRFDDAPRRRLLSALVQHGDFVLQNLEVGARPGNHYLTDGVGLLALGLTLRDVPGAGRWLERGWRIVWGEAERQVTPDGVDYEHAIGYHGYVLECLLFALALCRRNGMVVHDTARERLSRMLEFTAAYTRPDGTFPAVGDADDGSLVRLSARPDRDHRHLLALGGALFAKGDLKAAARGAWTEVPWWLGPGGLAAYDRLPPTTPGEASSAFPHGGFFVMRGRDRHLTISGGAPGPASHVHQDLLSFECWADGRAYIVDPGTCGYTASREWRNRFRSTAAHNTLMVDGHEQTRLLDDPNLFPVLRDGPAGFILHRWEAPDGGRLDHFDGEHTGYTRLAEPVRHRRRIWFDREAGIWAIRDQVAGTGTHRLSGFLQLAPLPATIRSTRPWIVEVGDDERALLVVFPDPEVSVAVRPGWVSPRYGVRQASSVIGYETHVALPASVAFLLVPRRGSTEPDVSALIRWSADLS